MKNFQYDELTRTKKNGDFKPPQLRKIIGKTKGSIGVFTDTGWSKDVSVLYPDGSCESGHYSKFDILDDAGNVVDAPTLDATSRPINVGDYLVYSVASGRSNHALEVGKVMAFSKIGVVQVKRILHNGDPASKMYGGDKLKPITDPDRCIKLPIDATNLIVWMMKDFKDLGDDA